MFEIDLKKGARPIAAPARAADDLSTIALSFAPVAAGVAVLAVALSMFSGRLDRSITQHEANVADLEASLSASRQQLAEVSGKRRVLYGVGRQEVYWSDELRLMSEKLPDKAWINQIRVAAAPAAKGPNGEATTAGPATVTIEGGVLSNSSEGNLDVIGKFVQDLQTDRRFQDTFSAINLESVQRTSDPFALAFRMRLDFKS
ncbi:MAG TPA: hypothetical protein VMR29_06555 [Candidatus Binatia bacterium]|nr:hypothetical protein [Candidatus Binatia bacterium]